MTTYPPLPLIFVAAGLVLLFAVSYLARLFRRHRHSLSALLELAQSNLDPLQLPAAAWPALARGGIKRLEYSGRWFGQPVQDAFGATREDCTPRPFDFHVKADGDVSLAFRCHMHTGRGEARLLAEHLSGVFHLLLETAVHSKMEALSAALSEQARLMLYLQHDLRNLAQWVEWLAADFTEADADLLGIALRLRSSAPHAAARAQRILDAICKPPAAILPTRQPVALRAVLQQAAEHAGIAVTLSADSLAQDDSVWLRRDLLERTLDNLFGQAAPLLRAHPDTPLSVTLTHQADTVLLEINMPRLAETAQLPPERLFEPFASGHPGGLGLGLYQARKSLFEAGGELAAEVREHRVCFLLNLPATAASAAQV